VEVTFSRKKLLPWLILAAGISGFVVLQATKPKPAEATPQERVWRVAVQVLQPQVLAPQVRGLAQVVTQGEITYLSPIAARLEALPVISGQWMQPGQPLFTLDRKEVALTVSEAKAKLAQAQAQADFAQASLTRLKALNSQKLTSQNDLEQAIQGVAVQQANLNAAQVALDKALLNQKRSNQVAPSQGRITQVFTSQDNLLPANGKILSFLPEAGLRLRLRLSDAHTRAIEAALDLEQSVSLSLEQRPQAQFVFETFEGQASAKGSLAVFKPLNDTQDLRNLQPESVQSVVMVLPSLSDVYFIPYAALYGRDGVYLLDPQNRLIRATVQVLGQTRNSEGDWGLLVAGDSLKPGESLLTTHLPNAITGLKVDATSGL
jgi:RND family efflux transporter MFP subunit